jgi:hypothetical protein
MHSMYRGRVAYTHRGAMMMGRAQRGAYGRQKFAVSVDDAGVSHIALDSGEVAEVTVSEPGETTITIAKPNGDGENGNNGNGGNGGERGLLGRLVNRMSCEKNPTTGEITFTPADDETLSIFGDANSATVIAEPSTPSF